MRVRCWTIGLCLLGIGGIAPLTAAPPKKPPMPPVLDADKLPPGVFTGTLVSTPNPERMFTLNVTYQKLQLKPGQNLGRTNANLQRQYNHITQLQNRLMHPGRHHNPLQIMQQLQNAMVQFEVQAARAQANLFQVVAATQKVDFQTEENVKVRLKALPEEFDDKGNIKKYSRDELAELKGKDKNLPGYQSSADALKAGQLVQVTLGAHKKPRPVPAGSSASSKDRDADKDKDTSSEHKMQVRMIVILKDSEAAPNATTPPKKKK